MDEIEAKALVSSQVTSLLEIELDRLNQYGRRTSLIIKGIPVKERETNEEIEKKVLKIITDDLQLADEAGELDKTHRIGPKHDGGKTQDVIVRM